MRTDGRFRVSVTRMCAPIGLQQFDVVGREEADFALDLSFPPTPFVLHKHYQLLTLRVRAYVCVRVRACVRACVCVCVVVVVVGVSIDNIPP